MDKEQGMSDEMNESVRLAALDVLERKSAPTATGCRIWNSGLTTDGYGKVNISGYSTRRAHRVAYLIANGKIADGALIDHVCGERRCIEPSHLREVDAAGNSQNLKPIGRSNNKSGYRGVHYRASEKVWIAQAQVSGKYHHIGRFSSAKEANESAIRWRREHMPDSLFDRERIAPRGTEGHVIPDTETT